MSASNQQFDLVHDLQVQLKWQPSFAQAAKNEYMRWLRLRADAGDYVSCKLPPSRVVAMVWNIHRQWTLDYENTCQALGGYIHHYPPAMRMDIEWEQAYAATIHNYKQIYKQDPPSAYWGPAICPYKAIGDDHTPKESKTAHPTGRRASTKRESARNHSNAKITTRQSELTTRRSADIASSTASALKDRANNTPLASSRRKSTKIFKNTVTPNTRDTITTDNDNSRNGPKRRRFPGSSPHFVLKPLAPGEKRKRGRPSFSDYILADDAPPTTPLPKKKDIKTGASEKLLSPRTPVSTRSLGRRRSTTSTRAAASITKKEKSKPLRRIARASNGISSAKTLRDSTSRNKNQTTDSDEIDVASTLPKDVVLEHVVKRPRGRPRKDGSWPTQRTSRKNDIAAKAAIARAAVSKLVSSKSAASKILQANKAGPEAPKATPSEATASKPIPAKSSTVPAQTKESDSGKNEDKKTAPKEETTKKGETVTPPLTETPSIAGGSSGLPAVAKSTPAVPEKPVSKPQPAPNASAKDAAATAKPESAETAATNATSAPTGRMSIAPLTSTSTATRPALPIASATNLPPVQVPGSTPNQVGNSDPVPGPKSKDVIMAEAPRTVGNSVQSPGKAIETADIRMQDLSDKEQTKPPNPSEHSTRDPVFDQIIDAAPVASKDRSADIASGLLPKNVQVGQDVVFPQPGGMNNPAEMDVSMGANQRSEALPGVPGAPATVVLPSNPGTDKILPQVRGYPIGGMTLNPINQPTPLANTVEGGLLPVAPGGLLTKTDSGVPKEGIPGQVGGSEPRPQIKRPRGRPRKEAAWPSNRPKTIGDDGVERTKDVNDPSQALNFPMGPSGTV